MTDMPEGQIVDDFLPTLMNTLKVEGGYNVDNGMPTNFGIKQDTLDNYTSKNKLPEMDVKDLKFGTVKKLYETEYYKNPKIDTIPASRRIRSLMFDFGVNSGQGTAIKALQKEVGTKVDGIIGPKTQKSVDTYIKKYGEDALYGAMMQSRIELYRKLATEKPEKHGKNLQGWFNRLERLAGEHSK